MPPLLYALRLRLLQGAVALVVHLVVELVDKLLIDLTLHVAHGVFLLGILFDLGHPGATRLHVVVLDAAVVLLRDLLDAVVVEDEAVGPGPLIDAVVAMNLLKPLDDVVDRVERTVLDVLDEAVLLRGGEQESAEVVPAAQSRVGLGFAEESPLWARFRTAPI